MWKFPEDTDGNNREEVIRKVKSSLEALPALIPEISTSLCA